jgi:hypothetical protein
MQTGPPEGGPVSVSMNVYAYVIVCMIVRAMNEPSSFRARR